MHRTVVNMGWGRGWWGSRVMDITNHHISPIFNKENRDHLVREGWGPLHVTRDNKARGGWVHSLSVMELEGPPNPPPMHLDRRSRSSSSITTIVFFVNFPFPFYLTW